MRNLVYQISEVRRYAQKIGWRAALGLRYFDFKKRIGLNTPDSMMLKLKSVEYPVIMRTGGSDRGAIHLVFIETEYEPIELLQPKMIVDLGANVGYSSVYFLSKYPTAKIVAVEPHPDNYAICRQNLAPFGERAKLIHGAVWPELTKLELSPGIYRDGLPWSTQVKLAPEDDVRSTYVTAYDMDTLMGFCDVSEIDLLKIDIERSELELFSRNTERWLPRVRSLCIELHDTECEAAFFQALSRYTYDLTNSGELTICSNLRMR